MDQGVYQRPREKLRDNGAAFLTLVELIQIIISSGSRQVSGAKLARRLQRALEHGKTSYGHLTMIQGIGPAKACQLLAAIELGRRLQRRENKNHANAGVHLRALFAVLREGKKALFACNWYDGSGALLECKRYEYKKHEHYSNIVRAAFVDGLSLGARMVIVALSSEESKSPSIQGFGTVHAIKGAASLLGIHVKDLYGVSPASHANWSKEV